MAVLHRLDTRIVVSGNQQSDVFIGIQIILRQKFLGHEVNGTAERSNANRSTAQRADAIYARFPDEVIGRPVGDHHEALHRHALRGGTDDGAVRRSELNLSRDDRSDADVRAHEYQLGPQSFLFVQAKFARGQNRHGGETRRWIGDSNFIDRFQAPSPANDAE